MALKFRLEGLFDGGDAVEFHDPSACFGGTSGSQQTSSGSSNSTTTPVNFQNPAFVGNSPFTVGNLNGLVSNYNANQGPGGGPSINASGYVAPVTGAESSTLGAIGSVLNGSPTGPQNIANELIPTLVGEGQNPGQFASQLATSPQTQGAIQSALQPIQQQFNAQTVPGLQGSFTQAGQRVGTEQGSGSSAFDNAFANAQGSELATEAATAGSISNSAYQTGLNIGANAPAQASALSSSELSNLISGLNAQTLPQLTQQYGINQGLSTYNQMTSTLLQALGLETQGAQPSLGYYGNSNSSEQGSGSSSGFNISPFGGASNGSGGFGFTI